MGRGRRMGRGAESTDRSRAEMPLGDPFVFRSAPLVIPWRPFRFLYCRFQLLKIAELLHLRWKTDRRGLLLLFIGGKKGKTLRRRVRCGKVRSQTVLFELSLSITSLLIRPAVVSVAQ